MSENITTPFLILTQLLLFAKPKLADIKDQTDNSINDQLQCSRVVALTNIIFYLYVESLQDVAVMALRNHLSLVALSNVRQFSNLPDTRLAIHSRNAR